MVYRPRKPEKTVLFEIVKKHYLQKQTLLQKVLHIVIDEIKKALVIRGPDISNVQIGAISFIQHFGNTLNAHPHFHILFADGIFSGEREELRFYESYLTQDTIADVQDKVRCRVLRFFKRKGFFAKEDLEKMLKYENSGFSLDATVRIESWDREGLERIIRYCARPPFASENLRWNGPWISYRLPKPSRTGQKFIQLDPLEFLERISVFIPYPRHHRRHYHGVFAPNSPLRKKSRIMCKNGKCR